MNTLQKNFKILREISGLSQSQLSLELGFSRGTWNNYETGKSTPSLDDFQKITKYFGRSASEILEKDLDKVKNDIKKLESMSTNDAGDENSPYNNRLIEQKTVDNPAEKDQYMSIIIQCHQIIESQQKQIDYLVKKLTKPETSSSDSSKKRAS